MSCSEEARWGCGLGPANEGAILFGSYNLGEVRRLRRTSDGRLGNERVVFRFAGRTPVLSLETDPQGHIHFCSYTAIFRLIRG